MRTQQARSHRGASTVGIVIGVVVVALVGFAVLYFTSDVFRTKAKEAYKEFSQWTPANIAADPKGYLSFCEEQTNAAIQKAKTSEIAIAQKRSKIEDMHKDAETKSNVGAKALDELKAAYKAAEEKNEWPLTWKGSKFDKDAARRQILKTKGEVKSKNELLDKLSVAIKQLERESNKLAELRDNAKDQLAKIDASRQMLAVQEITDDLKKTLVDMKAAIQTSVVGVANSEPGSLSLEEIAAKTETTVSDDEFNKVLNEK